MSSSFTPVYRFVPICHVFHSALRKFGEADDGRCPGLSQNVLAARMRRENGRKSVLGSRGRALPGAKLRLCDDSVQSLAPKNGVN